MNKPKQMKQELYERYVNDGFNDDQINEIWEQTIIKRQYLKAIKVARTEDWLMQANMALVVDNRLGNKDKLAVFRALKKRRKRIKMSGYIGQSRSVRSDDAISNYEVPLSHVNKELIMDVCEWLEIELKKEYTVSFIKYAAEANGASSWHHTGKYYNQTSHYDVLTLIEGMSSHPEEFENLHKKYQDMKLQEKNTNREIQNEILPPVYVTFKENVWEGSRKWPKLVVYERVGVKYNGWIYGLHWTKYKENAQKNHSFQEHKTIRTLKLPDFEQETLKRIKNKLRKNGKL